MGISCEVFEEALMALPTAIEASHYKELVSSSKLGSIEKKELKRLSCSINYDSKGCSSSLGRTKGRAILGYYEA